MISAVAWCARCRRPAPIAPDELAGDDGGDPSVLPVLVPPPGWLPDPHDEDRIICRPCATDEAELDEYDQALDDTERVIFDEQVAQVIEEEGGLPEPEDWDR